MGRKKLNKERLEVKVDQELLTQVRAQVTLKYNDKPQHGAISVLVEILLRKWLEEEVLVDPMRPVSVSLNDLIEEYAHGQVLTDRAASDGSPEKVGGGEAG